MKWEQGRQSTNYPYYKMLLFKGSWFDCYLLKYPCGSSIPTHTDPVPGKKHYRINIRLTGRDNYRGKSLFKLWRFRFFRPDIMPHEVTLVCERRYVLSIGWVI